MKVAISGSKGFIGSYLVNELKKQNGIEINEFDRTRHDLLNVSSLESFVENADCVVHLAGLNRALENELIMINVLGTLNLLEAIRRSNKTKVIFIFASSFQVYGPLSRPRRINEETILNPQTIYGYSKKFAEELIRFYSKKYEIKGIILRLSNVYGPGCKPNYNSVIATFCYKAVRGEVLYVNDRNASRDYVYVRDVVNAIKKCLEYDVKGTVVFNVCSSKLFSLEEITGILRKYVEIKIEYGKDNEQWYLLGDNTKIKRLLNFNAWIEFEIGLRKTLESYKK